MEARVIVVFLCLAVALAVRSHGPAHVETDHHARNSQRLAEKLWHMQKTHSAEITSHIQELASRTSKQHMDELASGSAPEMRRTRQRLNHMYHPSPAISLLEKISYSKQIQPEAIDDEAFMKELFGFDEKKMLQEVAKLQQAEPEVVQGSRDEAGFSEEAIKAAAAESSKTQVDAQTKSQQAPEQEIGQLLQVEEGVEASAEAALAKKRRAIDWKKWDRFMLNEFEAARMTGDLDAVAHRVPAPIVPAPRAFKVGPAEKGITANLELAEGTDKGLALDKLCGCEVTLSHPVCGSDGETYPSECFAKCAGLSVSHSGSCLSKSTITEPGSFKTLGESLDAEQLIALGGAAASGDAALVYQEAGVDFPSLPSQDATTDAAAAVAESAKPREIKLPFDHVVTKRQFEEDMKELGHIADEFAPAMNDERMAKCDCHGDYSPVCGRDYKTYPSPCYASCMGMELLHVGVCRDRPHLGEAPHTMEEVRDPLCFCSFKQKQVCGVNGKTYVNRCFADCEGMKIRGDGPCYDVQA